MGQTASIEAALPSGDGTTEVRKDQPKSYQTEHHDAQNTEKNPSNIFLAYTSFRWPKFQISSSVHNSDHPNILMQASTSTTTQLFRWVDGGASGGGNWELISNNAGVNFFNENEDSVKKAPQWRLELEGAQDSPSMLVDDTFVFNMQDKIAFVPIEGEYYSLRFPDVRTFVAFSQKYNKARAENVEGKEIPEPMEIKIEDELSRGQWVDALDEQPDPAELRTPKKERVAAERQEQISGIVLGAGERSFLINESGTIGVMRNVMGGMEDLDQSFAFDTPSRLSNPGTPIGNRTPGSSGSKALLMNQERRMNMLTPGSKSLYHADIESGKVIREFAFKRDGADLPMLDIASETKRSQLESQSTFLSLDSNRLARWDLRDPSGIVQDMSSPATLEYTGGRDYARGTKFSCMATSGAGYVIVGSNDGKIRLYSEKTLTQAKTSIPGLGAPITNVDVTFDGKWALATTNKYLMVAKTTYKDSSGTELCGFTSKMGKDAPAPRLLRLKPEDVARTVGAPLRDARFTWVTEQGRQERWIIASCGNYTVLWNFRVVKTAEPDITSMQGLTTVTNYHMIAKQEHVRESRFMHDNFQGARGEAGMVVVTGRKVYTAADDDSNDDEEEATTPKMFGRR